MHNNLSWKTHEYKHSHKSSDWFWILGIIGISVAVAAIIFGDALFAVVILLATFGIALFAVRKPNLMHIEVSDRGIVVDKSFLPYQNLESFWIDDSGETKLLLKSKRLMMPLIVIPLVDHSMDDVRVLLTKHLKEEHLDESVWQKIMDGMGV
jgi:hypothetical protein